jgi:hypothetical protein
MKIKPHCVVTPGKQTNKLHKIRLYSAEIDAA